jgi:hypothetical protein
MATVDANAQLFDEVIDFLVSAPTPEQIIAFGPSDALQARVRYLLDANRNATLTAEERAELDEFARLNHFMSMLKARAREKTALA